MSKLCQDTYILNYDSCTINDRKYKKPSIQLANQKISFDNLNPDPFFTSQILKKPSCTYHRINRGKGINVSMGSHKNIEIKKDNLSYELKVCFNQNQIDMSRNINQKKLIQSKQTSSSIKNHSADHKKFYVDKTLKKSYILLNGYKNQNKLNKTQKPKQLLKFIPMIKPNKSNQLEIKQKIVIKNQQQQYNSSLGDQQKDTISSPTNFLQYNVNVSLFNQKVNKPQTKPPLCLGGPWRHINDCETIVSHEDSPLTTPRSIKIQQSIICTPRLTKFIVISQKYYYQNGYCIYLAKQKFTGVLISIKQIPENHLQQVCSQLSVYSRINTTCETFKHIISSILEIYQSSIQNSKYILIKQPYTQNLQYYLLNLHPQRRNSDMRRILIDMEEVLKCYSFSGLDIPLINIIDIVECNGIFKLHNLFKPSKRKYSIQESIYELELQIIEFFKR